MLIGNNPRPWAYIDSITSQPASMVEQQSHLAPLSDGSTHNITHAITLAYDSITSQPASMVEQRSHLAHLSDFQKVCIT